MSQQKTSIPDTVTNLQASDVLQQSIVNCICSLGTAVVHESSCAELWETDEHLLRLHQQLLYFVYRLVYLRTIDIKGWNVHAQFRLSNIRNKTNIWNELLQTMTLKWQGDASLNIKPVATELWSPSACSLVTNVQLTNEQCDKFLTHLLNNEDTQDCDSVDWYALTPIDLSVSFESILEFVPSFCKQTKVYSVSIREGNTRKSSGSYYTPPQLTDRVLQSTLVPAIKNAIEQSSLSNQEDRLLAIKVCDPSCGSGNFLMAAAHLMATKLTEIRLEEGLKWDVVYQKSLHDVLSQCIYGVDFNPLTVEVCKLVLWLALNNADENFEIFQGSIRCGNALLWATPALIEKGVQTEYFELISPQDNRDIRNQIAKRNRLERRNALQESVELETPVLKDEKASLLADAVCASLVWPKIKGWEEAPTHSVFEGIKEGYISKKVQANIQKLKLQYRFFHWHLEFFDIFEQGGFDVVIGNPPYLASRYLSKHHPYQRRAIPKMYSTASGNWDIYIPFTELGISVLKPHGYQAYVTPNKIIGAEYASTLQREVFFRQTMLEVHDYSKLNLFEGANVAVVIVVNQKQFSTDDHEVYFYRYEQSVAETPIPIQARKTDLQSLPTGFISFPITASDQTLLQWVHLPHKISNLCHVSDGLSTDQAYKIAKYVTQGRATNFDDKNIIKLVNTGTIDPFHLQWGEKNIKFLGFEGTYPVVDEAYLQEKYPKRKGESELITVGIAGLSTRLEATVLPRSVLSGVATVLLIPVEGVCPYALTAVLNTKVYSALYKALFGMSGMTADVLNYSSRQVARLPLPNIEYLRPFTGDTVQLQYIEEIDLSDGVLSLLGKYGHRSTNESRDPDFSRMLEENTLRVLRCSLNKPSNDE